MNGVNDIMEILIEYNAHADEIDLLIDLRTLSRISPMEWEDAIEKEARKQRRCPECFEKLEKQSYTQYHPFGDTMVGENYIELSCPEHGMI